MNTNDTIMSEDSARTLARGLGWFSIALGAAELAAPGALARSLGMEGSERILQAYGVREIATGVGALMADDPTPWIWGRVAGDAVDLATLAKGETGDNPQRANVHIAIAAVLGVTVLDAVCAAALTANRRAEGQNGDAAAALPPAAADIEGPDELRPFRDD